MSILSSSSYHSKLQMPELFFSIKRMHRVTKLLKGQKKTSEYNKSDMTCVLYSKSSKAIFTFIHLADTFIQSDLHCIQGIYFLFFKKKKIPLLSLENWTHNFCIAVICVKILFRNVHSKYF